MHDLPQQVRQLLHELPGQPPYTYTPPAHAHVAMSTPSGPGMTV